MKIRDNSITPFQALNQAAMLETSRQKSSPVNREKANDVTVRHLPSGPAAEQTRYIALQLSKLNGAPDPMHFESRICPWLLLLSYLLVFGCSASSPTVENTAAKPKTVSDDVASVEALEAAGAKFKKDGNGNVTEVDFRGTSAGDDVMIHLAGLPAVRSLLLNDTDVTDAGMQAIGKLETLTNLDLRGCAITNQGVSSLAGLSNLKALRFSGKSGKTDITDESMPSIGKLTKLKVLALDFLKFAAGAEGLSHLNQLTQLQELYAANTLINDDSLEVIARSFPTLKKLRAAASQVSDDGLAQIAKMSQLEELDVSENSQITDEGLVHLASMKQLKKLNLWRVQITDAGVEQLAGLTNLEWLNLDNVAYLSDAGLVHLKGMQNLKFLHLGSTMITDDGLVHLEPLTSLDDLKVTRTGVTEEGVTALKKTLSDTEIQLKYIAGE